jgi:hypothetical protein
LLKKDTSPLALPFNIATGHLRFQAREDERAINPAADILGMSFPKAAIGEPRKTAKVGGVLVWRKKSVKQRSTEFHRAQLFSVELSFHSQWNSVKISKLLKLRRLVDIPPSPLYIMPR